MVDISAANVLYENLASVIPEVQPANDGTINTSDQLIRIRKESTITSIADGAFFPDDATYYTITGIPTGLSIKIENSSGSAVRLSATGQATNHANSDSRHVTVELLPKMFQGKF